MKFTVDEAAILQNRLTLVVEIKHEGMFGITIAYNRWASLSPTTVTKIEEMVVKMRDDGDE
ncbi:hypothetical protein Hanom_Chr05g00397451 [Helianthus anomalus]